MTKHKIALGGAGLMLGISLMAAYAQTAPTTPPAPPKFDAQQTPTFVGIKDILEFKALPEYHEADFVKAFVDAGKLPPVGERLPKEPMVYKTGNMPDGLGVYGDVIRHVIGGRPEGWNYSAGQTQGWGGIDIGLSECLTRTGPLFQVKAEELEPLPNLAKSWEWSEDGHQLTMHIIEGAKWSDGVPFTTDDLMFYWNDILGDSQITPLNGATRDTFGVGTSLEKVDEYTVKWTFKDVRPTQFLYAMAYGNFCPGPAHLLQPEHPKYKDGATYDQFKNAFPPEYLNMPTMGGWVPVEYRPNDIIVLRRNPYYWKVDEAGNQLPYLNEMQYRLSTWADRDVQTVAGSADLSNLEQPEGFVEALRRSADPAAPARLAFGARTISYSVYPNLSANGWGEPDGRGQAVRELNRNVDFRKAISYALDRTALGEALVKGPFTSPYAGGLMPPTSYYDDASTTYYPFSLDDAKALLEKAGLKDTDGNGFVNFPADVQGGADVEVTLLATTDYQTDKSLAEGVIAQMERLGIRVIAQFQAANQRDANEAAGKFDWTLRRNESELITVVQNTQKLAPMGPQIARGHRAGPDGTLDLLPFEQEMVNTVDAFVATADAGERVELMKTYQKLYTENLFGIGLTQYPGALIINKRFDNVPPGTPILQFNWAEDGLIRERLFVPEADQSSNELHANTLPGEPGKGNGPLASN